MNIFITIDSLVYNHHLWHKYFSPNKKEIFLFRRKYAEKKFHTIFSFMESFMVFIQKKLVYKISFNITQVFHLFILNKLAEYINVLKLRRPTDLLAVKL